MLVQVYIPVLYIKTNAAQELCMCVGGFVCECRVEVDGDTPMDVSIHFPVSLDLWPMVSPGLTAHGAVNAVPFVCAAASGIRTAVELPQIIQDLSERAKNG